MKKSMHILVYIRRRLGNGRNISNNKGQFAEESLFQPAGHGFGQEWLYKRAKESDSTVIWLFSLLRYGELCLPPSLDARIEVEAAFSQKSTGIDTYTGYLLKNYKFAVSAKAQDSCYLPWNHATPILRSVLGEDQLPPAKSRVLAGAWYSQTMQKFQTPRLLPPSGASTLDDYAKKIKRQASAFISYRRREAPVAAMQCAARLEHLGISPWWDQWAMPRKVAEEKAMLDSDPLRLALQQAIQRADYAVTLHTKSYGTSSSPWTQHELDQIEAAAKRKSLKHIRVSLDLVDRDPRSLCLKMDRVLSGV